MKLGGLDPGVTIELALVGLAYLWCTVRVARWEGRRTCFFLAGLAVLVVCAGPLEAGAEDSLAAHMAQHLTLILIAPPLLLWGAPVRLLLAVLPAPYGRSVVRLLRSAPLRTLLLPSVAVAVYAAVLLATHVPAIYDAALRHPVLHGLEHIAYLSAGLLLWAPLVGGVPLPVRISPLGRVLYLMVAMLPGILISLWLMTAADPVYPFYMGAEGAAAAADDQGQAAMVMFAGGGLTMAAAIVLLGWRAILAEEERQRIRDAHDERVATRLGGAGGGAA